MRYYLIFFFIIITNTLKAQVMLPAYQGVQHKNLNTSVHAINDSYAGGIIIYILISGDPGYDPAVQHGLIAASVDQGTVAFAPFSPTIYATTYDTLGTGKVNTDSLVAAGGTSVYAASLCNDYSVVGTDGITYSDWYLPSKDELNKLYLYNTSFGGLSSNYYWSSSLYSPYGNTRSGIWSQSFSSGSLRRTHPTSTYYVRAMRSF